MAAGEILRGEDEVAGGPAVGDVAILFKKVGCGVEEGDCGVFEGGAHRGFHYGKFVIDTGFYVPGEV